MSDKENIEYINTVIDDTKEHVELSLKYIKRERMALELLYNIRQTISEKSKEMDDLKNMARKILGEDKQVNVVSKVKTGDLTFKSIEDKRDTEPEHQHTETKYCPKCKTEKTTSSFPIDVSRDDGLRIYCKECVNEYERKRYKRNYQKDGFPKGWHIYKQFIDGHLRETTIMSHLFDKEFPDKKAVTIERYIRNCRDYAEDKLDLIYKTELEGGVTSFRFVKSPPDIPITNGTKTGSIPVTPQPNIDRKSKTIRNWKDFLIGAK